MILCLIIFSKNISDIIHSTNPDKGIIGILATTIVTISVYIIFNINNIISIIIYMCGIGINKNRYILFNI